MKEQKYVVTLFFLFSNAAHSMGMPKLHNAALNGDVSTIQNMIMQHRDLIKRHPILLNVLYEGLTPTDFAMQAIEINSLFNNTPEEEKKLFDNQVKILWLLCRNGGRFYNPGSKKIEMKYKERLKSNFLAMKQ